MVEAGLSAGANQQGCNHNASEGNAQLRVPRRRVACSGCSEIHPQHSCDGGGHNEQANPLGEEECDPSRQRGHDAHDESGSELGMTGVAPGRNRQTPMDAAKERQDCRPIGDKRMGDE